MRIRLLLPAVLAAVAALAVPEPRFYLPLDNTPRAARAGGLAVPLLTAERDPILAALGPQFAAAAKVAGGLDARSRGLAYSAAGNFRADEGTFASWLQPAFSGADKTVYPALFGVEKWGMLYKYTDQTGLTFGTARPDRDLYYDCAADIGSWRPGEWHHVAVSWSRSANARALYLDGVQAARAPFPYHRPVESGPLFVGGGCLLYPGHHAQALLDEVALWDRALTPEEVRQVCDAGRRGEALAPAAPAAALPGDTTGKLTVAKPVTPPPPGEAAPPRRERGPVRDTLVLDGWWAFRLDDSGRLDLPATGWGWARTPGYFRPADRTIVDPDGQPFRERWGNRPLAAADGTAGYYRREVAIPDDWRGRPAALEVDGVDGFAELFVNDTGIGRLLPWEPGAWQVDDLLRPGADNTVTVVLTATGNGDATGIPGRIVLRTAPGPCLGDIVVTPHVSTGRIAFSCAVWGAPPGDRCTLRCEVASAAEPTKTVRRFDHPFVVPAGGAAKRELWARQTRLDWDEAWPDAHLWCCEDPFLYVLRVKVLRDERVVDETPEIRFGFREFTQQGGTYLLNGVPTHLRGHQVDLAWGDKPGTLRELKDAGMNAFEFSGPITHLWKPTPRAFSYNPRVFEGVLNEADELGLIAIPCLPGADQLQEAIFEEPVATLYRQRLAKHVRRYGNHPSICLWFMHFNLAGSHSSWHLAPARIDGTYKTANGEFRRKERFALEAQRFLREVDARPLYHHHCGNLGDAFTMNVYIGPETPVQEREEWPSQWAASRRLPLIACEHGLFLVPYWFRHRAFPLSDVYASEPLFEEFAARLLGPRAYEMLTPEGFDLYALDAPKRGRPLMPILAQNQAYQTVKAEVVARHSLRAWRTYGVSGIIFNAERWDFRGADGGPTPVMRALQRYFGDLDFYVAGPADDTPSKDHAYYSGETIRKQIVLINDRTQALASRLRWDLLDAADQAVAGGDLEAQFQPGTPVFLPLTVTPPAVEARRAFTLRLRAAALPDREDRVALQVFPRPTPPGTRGRIVLHDPPGDTRRLLQKAGWTTLPNLDARTDLGQVDLLVVGRRAFDAAFLALAQQTRLAEALEQGLNLLVFEQTVPEVLGLRLCERSERNAYIAAAGHPLLAGLDEADFADLRGASDLIEAYPDPAPGTEAVWPKRFYKWSNRGIVATFVFTRPHRGPYRALLQSGFDLTEAPLLEARQGKGRVVLCQVDVTPRYGRDPVATRLTDNLLHGLGGRGETDALSCAWLGHSAAAVLDDLGLSAGEFVPGFGGVVVVGKDAASQSAAALELAVRRGATAFFLPGTAMAETFGLQRAETKLFRGLGSPTPWLAGLNHGDFYLKRWQSLPTARAGNGWETRVEPGLIATRALDQGRLVACELDPQAADARTGVKASRVWSVLLANAGVGGALPGGILEPTVSLYRENPWEQMPDYILW